MVVQFKVLFYHRLLRCHEATKAESNTKKLLITNLLLIKMKMISQNVT